MDKSLSDLKLGTSTCVLNGYDASWLTGTPTASGLIPVPSQPLEETVLDIPSQRGQWNYPHITLHDDAFSLLDELFPARIVNPGRETEEAGFSAGVLLTGDADRGVALARLKDLLGIDLSVPNRGYALARVIRKDASLDHASAASGILIHAHPVNPDPILGVNEEFRQALSRLRPCLNDHGIFHPQQLSPNTVNDYLNFFREYGTHFVSGVDMGDCLFQVFAYDADKYPRVKKAFTSPSSSFEQESSGSFAYFTTSAVTGKYGYAAEIGKIVAFSGDAALAASLEAGEWLEPNNAKCDSLFAIFNANSPMTLASLNERYTASVAIRYELSTLTLFAETQRREAWSRIFAGAMVQKYPLGTQPNLRKYFRSDSSSLFGSSNIPGFASALATPNINVYKPRVESSQLTFVAAETVKSFTLCANLLAFPQATELSLPGADPLLSVQAVAAETREGASTLRLRGTSTSPSLHCRLFFGILRFVYSDDGVSCTILDGIRLVTKPMEDGLGRGAVQADLDLRQAPPATSLARLKSSLQFSYTFLQSAFHSDVLVNEDLLSSFLKDGLRWLAQQIPADTEDLDLLNIRMMALDLARGDQLDGRGAYVPLLPGDAYKDQVRDILSMLDTIAASFVHIEDQMKLDRTNELVIATAKTLNENILASGKALLGYIDTSASYQRSLSGYYEGIAQSQENQYRELLGNISALQDQVAAQQRVVNDAVETYKNRVETWATMKAISASFEIIGGIFSLAAGGEGVSEGVKDATKAVSALANVVNKIKKILQILTTLTKAYSTGSTAAKEIAGANQTLDELDGVADLQLSQLEWDEMRENFSAILSSGPGEGSAAEARDALLSAYKILVLRGKALLDAQAGARRLAWELFNNQRMKTIAADQADRLKQLQAQFHQMGPQKLDSNLVDLVGLTSDLDLLQNQMLTLLSSAFTLQDQALQYQYLQPSTPVKSFNLLGFKAALAMQNANTLAAREKLSALQPNDTEDIEILIQGVPADSLTGGRTYQVSIGLDSRDFLEYIQARVTSVVASCDTKVTTPSGKFSLRLRCLADPFLDRDANRNKVVYHSLPREKTYLYASETMSPLFTDSGETWSAGVNPVTPFTTWEVSFPATALNKDIKLGSTLVDLRLRFRIHARVKDAPILRSSRMLRMAMPAGNALSRPPSTALLSQMAERGSVTNGWDIVYNMTLDKINASLERQFKKLQSDPQFANRILTETRTEVVTGTFALKKFDITYGYPHLTFLEKNPNNVLLSCHVEGTITRGMQDKENPPRYDEPAKVSQEMLKASIPLSKLAGLVSPKEPSSKVYSVLLSLADGTFSAENMDLSDDEKVEFNKQLKAYFASKPVAFIINSLDMSQISTLQDLRPNQFLFKTLITPQNDSILQLFIQTGSPTGPSERLNESQTFLNGLPEPIPEGSDASLIISSRVFFKSVLPASMQSGWQLEGKDPGQSKAWYSRFKSGSISATVDTSGLIRSSSSSTFGGATNSSTDRVFLDENESNTLNWSIEGMTIKPTSQGNLHLEFDQARNVPYVVKTTIKECALPTSSESHETTRYSSDLTVTITARLPISVSGSGREQYIGIAVENESMQLNGNMSGGGPCGLDSLSAKVNKTLQDQVPGQITQGFNMKFNNISVFALQNLLFPSDSVIQLISAHIPGDLVIFGGFQ